jgi:hypothetical protein
MKPKIRITSRHGQQEKGVAMANRSSSDRSTAKGAPLDSGVKPTASKGGFPKNARTPFSSYRPSIRQRPGDRGAENVFGEYYDALEDDFLSFEGVVLARRNGGLSFKTNRPLAREMPVLLRCGKPLNGGVQEDSKSGGVHAKVVACDKAEAKDGSGCYKIGVRYFQN